MDQDSYLPKYLKIKKDIKELIKEQKIKPGEKIPSENELANKHDVSRHTVRKALDLLLQEGLLYKEQGVGTFYGGRADNSTKIVGFVSISVHDYIFSDILSGIDDVLHEAGYQLLLGNSKDNIEREAEILNNMLERDIDGLIIEPAKSSYEENNIDIFYKIRQKNIPVVIIDSSFSDDNFSYVVVDDVIGGKTATSYLLASGHSKIAIIYKDSHLPGRQRFLGYKKALEEAGNSLLTGLIKSYHFSELETPDKFSDEIKKIVDSLLSGEPSPTAIFCFNDQVAVEVKEYLNLKGKSIPDDISLIGYDDSKLVKLNNIGITSVSHPKKLAGEKAAELMLKNLQEDNISTEKIVFEPELVKRDSVKKLN